MGMKIVQYRRLGKRLVLFSLSFFFVRYFLSLTMNLSYFGEIKVEAGFTNKPRVAAVQRNSVV